MKSKKDKPILEVIGGNSEGVTGSCTKISYEGKTYLFELGAIQSGKTVLENYRLNIKQLQKVKPKSITAVIISHCHHDHQGLIPALFKSSNCNATVIVPKGSTPILKEMWLDSCFINQRDAEYLTKKSGNQVEPLYTEQEVFTALSHIREVEPHKITEIDENISIRYIPAGHILLSQQCEMFIGKSHVYKILFTGDLGNVKIQDMKFYLENFEPVSTANIVIGECTYGLRTRETKDTLQRDLQKIKTVIDQFCVQNKGRVLIPTFALDRTLYFLSLLYELLGEDNDIPIILDSPLAARLLFIYRDTLQGEELEQFQRIMGWESLHIVNSSEESKSVIQNKSPKVILSASGMMTAGRSVYWTMSLLPRATDCILFAGYCGTDTLGYRIRNEKTNKTITINGKPIKNRCQIVELSSFSSHMQYSDLIKYYKNIRCDKIYLVHGDIDTKLSFKKDLEQAISDNLRTTKVIATNKSTKISF